MLVTYRGKRPEAQNIYTFEFKPPEPLQYKAGQYSKLLLPHQNADGRGEMHFFTISSSPTEPYLTITTKFSQPSSTFKQTLRSLEPSAKIEMFGPYGEFTLPEDPSQPAVLVAGGIGVTPFHSMLQFLKDKGESRPIHLIYAANSPAELVFRKLFDGLPSPFKVTYLVKEADANWQGATGQLSGQNIIELAGGLDNKLTYLSGPKPMVQAFFDQLTALGISEAKIKTDFFPGYQTI